jgi:hypothetical protein
MSKNFNPFEHGAILVEPEKHQEVSLQTNGFNPFEHGAVLVSDSEIQPDIKQEQSPSRVGQFFKGALSGFSRAAMQEAADQASSGVMDVGGMAVPISESTALANIPQKGIEALDSMRPAQNDGLGNVLYKAGEFGGGVASFPMMPGRAAAESGAKTVLSNLAKDVGAGSVIGAGSGTLQESGLIENPIAADAVSMVSYALARRNPAGAKNQVNQPLAQASKDLDIPVPNSMISENKVFKLADSFLENIPFVGKSSKKRQAIVGEKAIGELDKAYDSVLPKAELEGVKQRVKELYNTRNTLLPEEAEIVPKNLTSVVTAIKAELANIGSLTPGLKRVKSIIKDYQKITPKEIKTSTTENIVDGTITGSYPDRWYDTNANNYRKVKDLINTQDALGPQINWKDTTIDWANEKKASGMLKRLYNSIGSDLEQYGKTNPEWYQFHKKADKLNTKVHKREELEALLSGKAVNDATGKLSYYNLSKALHNKKSAAQIERLVEPEIFDRLKKLGTVARAVAIENKAISSQSWKSTAVQAATKIIVGLTGGGGAVIAPTLTGGVLASLIPLAHAISDRRFLDYAIRFSEAPTAKNAVTFSQRMKQITGYTPVTLLREAQKLEQGKEEKSKPQVTPKEPEKKAPAFNKTIEDMYNNKYIRNFIEAE